MKNDNTDNIIIVKSKTRLEQLTEKFNTQAQAKFYIQQSEKNFATSKRSISLKNMSSQEQEEVIFQTAYNAPLTNKIPQKKVKQAENTSNSSYDDYQNQHDTFYKSLDLIQKRIAKLAKIKIIDRSFLPNYIFNENDIVLVVGQDGLVANTAKYANNIPIMAINPDPKRYDGILLPFNVTNFEDTLYEVLQKRYSYKLVTMAAAKLNDGQKILAFNDLFIGPSTHTSARYKITLNSETENHSSSGVIVSTGAGSTGWLSSLFNMVNGISKTFHNSYSSIPPNRMEWDATKLIFVVREPFASKYSQINLTAGIINNGAELILESQMPENGIIFSDGIETDYIKFNSGAIATITIAQEKAKLVCL